MGWGGNNIPFDGGSKGVVRVEERYVVYSQCMRVCKEYVISVYVYNMYSIRLYMYIAYI